MPVYAIQVRKRHAWHGNTEDIGNVYHYQVGDESPETDMESIGVQLGQIESLVMPASVEYLDFTVFGPTDGPELENVIVGTFSYDDLQGQVTADQGASPVQSAMFVGWPLPRAPVTNRKRRLGKYLRPAYGACGNVDALAGLAAIPQDIQDFVRENYAQEVAAISVGTGEPNPLVTEDGVAPNADPYIANFITHRQITR